MTVIADKQPRSPARRRAKRNVPDALIYEMWAGKPVYYKDYRDVLAGKKTIEEVMRSAAQSCSDTQGVLVALLTIYLGNHIDRKKYLLATSAAMLSSMKRLKSVSYAANFSTFHPK